MVQTGDNNLMDDLAYQIHEFLLEQSIPFNGGHLVFLPVTELVKKFQKNHRTINRRLVALREEGLLKTLVTKSYGSLYSILDLDEES